MANVILAGLLSLLYPGVGQIYNKQVIKGIVFMSVQLILIVVNMVTFGGFNLLYWGVWLLAVLESIITAIKLEKRMPADQRFPRYKEKRVIIGAIVSITVAYGLHFAISHSLEGLLTNINSPSDAEVKNVKNEMINHLEDKYNQPFEVTHINYIHETNTYEMACNPKDDPDLQFAAAKTGDQLFDSYANLLWIKQSEKEFQPVIESVYPRHANLSSTIKVGDLNIEGDVPSFKDLRDDNVDYSQFIKLYVINDNKDKFDEVNRIYQIISFIEENNMTEHTSLTIEYYDSSLLKKGVERVDFQSRNKYREEFKYQFDAIPKQLEQIQSPEDVKKYLIDVDL